MIKPRDVPTTLLFTQETLLFTHKLSNSLVLNVRRKNVKEMKSKRTAITVIKQKGLLSRVHAIRNEKTQTNPPTNATSLTHVNCFFSFLSYPEKKLGSMLVVGRGHTNV